MMTEPEMRNIMMNVVELACDGLTDEELAALGNVALLDYDPHGRLFDYEKVKPLFTEANGTRMHSETKEALTRIISSRLGQ